MRSCTSRVTTPRSPLIILLEQTAFRFFVKASVPQPEQEKEVGDRLQAAKSPSLTGGGSRSIHVLIVEGMRRRYAIGIERFGTNH